MLVTFIKYDTHTFPRYDAKVFALDNYESTKLMCNCYIISSNEISFLWYNCVHLGVIIKLWLHL